MTTLQGLLIGLSIALGLYLLPRLVRVSVYLVASFARMAWWMTMWLLAQAICRRAETPKIHRHATDWKEHALALAFLAWGAGPTAKESRKRMVERWSKLGTELSEMRRATRAV